MAEYITKETAIKAIQGLCIEENTPQMIWSTDAMNAVRNATNGWISVKDRLPEEKQEALIFCCWTGASGEVYREIMIENIKSVIYQGYEPIAWMPLPEPPTEEQ